MLEFSALEDSQIGVEVSGISRRSVLPDAKESLPGKVEVRILDFMCIILILVFLGGFVEGIHEVVVITGW